MVSGLPENIPLNFIQKTDLINVESSEQPKRIEGKYLTNGLSIHHNLSEKENAGWESEMRGKNNIIE